MISSDDGTSLFVLVNWHWYTEQVWWTPC